VPDAVIRERFRAFVARKDGDAVRRGVEQFPAADLMDGDVDIAVTWSSVNFKDALATTPKGGVARIDPLIPGVDLAGRVVASGAPGIAVGDEVIVHCYGLGVSHHGGFAEYARVPASWVVPLPTGLTARDAMILDTAGYTAALCVAEIEARGVTPGDGPVVVTGATGGVGSIAVDLLAQRGHTVVASTGKPDQAQWLRDLGASDIIDRAALAPTRPLQSETWAGAIDTVGGDVLAGVISQMRYGGAIAAVGVTAGAAVPTTVYPFILRGVALLGVDAVLNPIDRRIATWQRLATDMRPRHLGDAITTEITLDGLEDALTTIHRGGAVGRSVVALA
jgi:acrylyl-CoA reductase (NADPH)